MGRPESADVLPRRLRVLIIEDEPILALDLKEFLSDDGFDVVAIAGKLSKALALIETTSFDIAVIDTNLAGVSAASRFTRRPAAQAPAVVAPSVSDETSAMNPRSMRSTTVRQMPLTATLSPSRTVSR